MALLAATAARSLMALALGAAASLLVGWLLTDPGRAALQRATRAVLGLLGRSSSSNSSSSSSGSTSSGHGHGGERGPAEDIEHGVRCLRDARAHWAAAQRHALDRGDTATAGRAAALLRCLDDANAAAMAAVAVAADGPIHAGSGGEPADHAPCRIHHGAAAADDGGGDDESGSFASAESSLDGFVTHAEVGSVGAATCAPTPIGDAVALLSACMRCPVERLPPAGPTEPDAVMALAQSSDAYQRAVQAADARLVAVRKVRLSTTGCVSARDFMARVYRLREALDLLAVSDACRQWMLRVTRELLARLMHTGRYNVDLFCTAYDDLVRFAEAYPDIVWSELRARGVVCFSVYDAVLDFIVLDAFEDLDRPPAALQMVLNNRWLPNGLKLQALSAAVYAVLSARAAASPQGGYLSRFYTLSRYTTPVLVLGLLGPASTLQHMCNAFRTHMLGFVREIFAAAASIDGDAAQLAVACLQSARRRYHAALRDIEAEGGGA